MSESKAFSVRLQESLRNVLRSPDSPTELARHFNAHFSGNPITTHAARKWLLGDSMPTQEKLRTLAKWLDVTPEWLRYGGPKTQAQTPERDPIDPLDARILADLQLLDAEHRIIAEQIIATLARLSRRK